MAVLEHGSQQPWLNSDQLVTTSAGTLLSWQPWLLLCGLHFTAAGLPPSSEILISSPVHGPLHPTGSVFSTATLFAHSLAGHLLLVNYLLHQKFSLLSYGFAFNFLIGLWLMKYYSAACLLGYFIAEQKFAISKRPKQTLHWRRYITHYKFMRTCLAMLVIGDVQI